MALTEKQESFCLAYVAIGNATEAYRRAYDSENMKPATINRTAKELLDNPKIAARLKELRAPAVEKAQLTIEDLLRELEEARRIALECTTPQSGAAVSATMGKAKLLGLDKQVVELTGKGGGAIVTRVERVIIDAAKD